MPRVRVDNKLSYSLLNELTSKTGNVYNKHLQLYAWYQFSTDVSSSGNLPDLSGNSRQLSAGDRPAAPTSDSPRGNFAPVGFPEKSAVFNHEVLLSSGTSTFNWGDGSSDNPFTVSAWIKPTVNDDTMYIATKWNQSDGSKQQWIFFLSNHNSGSRQLRLLLDEGSSGDQATAINSGVTLELNRWYHVAATYDGRGGANAANGIELYVDGQRVASPTRITSSNYVAMTNTGVKFGVGNSADDHADHGFEGSIAQVAVWSTALAEEDVRALYESKNGLAKLTSGFLNHSPRLELRRRDNATGSYPTILRAGDRDRSGGYAISFDDTSTMAFGKRIEDDFTLSDINSSRRPRLLGFTPEIDERTWKASRFMVIRRETFAGGEGNTARDGALVFAGPGSGSIGRFLETREKVRNPTIELDLVLGPYNSRRTVLGHGLGLTKGEANETLKVQASLTNGVSGWTTIRTFKNNIDQLFASASDLSFSEFLKLFNSRRRIKAKIHPSEFKFGNSPFYIRIVQDTIADNRKSCWALGRIKIDHYNEDVTYPLLVNASSRVGQKIVTESVQSPHRIPTITAPGRMISGISDTHLKFTPGEDFKHFKEDRVHIDESDTFFSLGTPTERYPGFGSRLSSKTMFEIDLTTKTDTPFGLTSRGTIHNTGDTRDTRGTFLETDDTVKQQLMVYWNNVEKRWEKIAQGVSGNAAASGSATEVVTTSLEDMISSGAIGFSAISMVSSGSTPGPTQVTTNKDVLSSYVRPTSVFGFPFAAKYHATSSQRIKARDIGITKPFLLEKCSLRFNSKFEFASTQHDSGSRAYSLLAASDGSSPSGRTTCDNQKVYIPTFFMLRQAEDRFSQRVEYDVEISDSSFGTPAGTKIKEYVLPDDTSRLGLEPTGSLVTDSRDLITYGQMTMFISGAKNSGLSGDGKGASGAQVNIDEVLERGLFRDANVNILGINGQPSWTKMSDGQINALTGTFHINFPCRTTGKILNGSQVILKAYTGGTGHPNPITGSLWLDNKIGGRTWDTVSQGSRTLFSGTPAFTPGERTTHFARGPKETPVNITPARADSTDLYSPYIIMPDDELIFGWQYPMTSQILRAAPGKEDVFRNSMTPSGESKLCLYGSLMKDGKEFHEPLNQNLASNNIHEAIGSEPILDQLQLSRTNEHVGTYLDSFPSSFSRVPKDRVGTPIVSRIDSEKGNFGNARATITLSNKQLFVTTVKVGFKDGDIITIENIDGRIVNVFLFDKYRRNPQYGMAVSGGTNNHSWSSLGPFAGIGQRLDGVKMRYGSTGAVDPATDCVDWSDYGDPSEPDKQLPLDPLIKKDGTLGSESHKESNPGDYPADALRSNLNDPKLLTECDVSSPQTSSEFGIGSSGVASSALGVIWSATYYMGAFTPRGYMGLIPQFERESITIFGTGLLYTVRMHLFQPRLGTVGNGKTFTRIRPSNIFDKDGTAAAHGSLNRIYSITGFRDGGDVVDSSLASFTGINQHQDERRIFKDSITPTPPAGSPNYGTLQTSGIPTTPKYYYNPKTFGQYTDLLRQGLDSTTNLLTSTITGKRRSISDVSLKSPVQITFVSGSSQESTKVRFFKLALPISSSNKDQNSVVNAAYTDEHNHPSDGTVTGAD